MVVPEEGPLLNFHCHLYSVPVETLETSRRGEWRGGEGRRGEERKEEEGMRDRVRASERREARSKMKG